jgi:peptidoglycan/xylan/chitin deacetylase (PgdA/CDA1 family)
MQILIRRKVALLTKKAFHDVWPIDENSGNPPENWLGWPDHKQFALVLTHDVEMDKGLDRINALMDLEKKLGLKSSFNFVAEDYQVPDTLLSLISDSGFEIGVHGLKHNSNPFRSLSEFKKQSLRINDYLKSWGAVGFRCPSMYHNLDWIHYLDIEYDMSTFDTDPFEPQPDGVGTIFPFWFAGDTPNKGFVELPYTLPQDFTLFVLLGENNIDTWKRKVDWVAGKGGMILVNIHPDYISFEAQHSSLHEYPARYYEELLKYIQDKYRNQYWNALPREVARFFVSVSQQ